MNEVGEWEEYSRLVLSELKNLNESAKEHARVLNEIDKTLIKQANQLDLHMSRTEAAEVRIEMLHNDMVPIKRITWAAGMFFKITGGLAFVVGLVAGIVEIVAYFQGK